MLSSELRFKQNPWDHHHHALWSHHVMLSDLTMSCPLRLEKLATSLSMPIPFNQPVICWSESWVGFFFQPSKYFCPTTLEATVHFPCQYIRLLIVSLPWSGWWQTWPILRLIDSFDRVFYADAHLYSTVLKVYPSAFADVVLQLHTHNVEH